MAIKKITVIYYLIVLEICLGLLFFVNDYRDVYTTLMSVVVCVSYIVSLILIAKQVGIISIQGFFMICLGIFAYGRIFVSLFSKNNFTEASYSIVGVFKWENSTIAMVLCSYLLFMAIFTLSTIFAKTRYNQKKIYERYISNSNLKGLKPLAYSLFWLSTPVTIVYFSMTALLIKNAGYTSFYTGGTNGLGRLGTIFSIFRLLFDVSFYLLICCERVQTKFDRNAVLYLGVNAIPLIQGSRANFIVVFLTIIFLRYVLFGAKIHFKWLISMLILGIPFLEMISIIRNGGSFSITNIGESYKNFFWELSASLNVPAYYLQYKSSLSDNLYPYIVEPLVRIIQVFSHPSVYNGGQSVDMIKIRFNLGHQITYFISPNYYLAGSNVASNFIGEMLEFGYGGVVVFSIILSKLINYISDKMCQKDFYLFMCCLICNWIFMLPRGETFMDTYTIFKFGIIFLGFKCIANIFYNTKKRAK